MSTGDYDWIRQAFPYQYSSAYMECVSTTTASTNQYIVVEPRDVRSTCPYCRSRCSATDAVCGRCGAPQGDDK